MKTKLRVVFFGELNSGFSRLHYEVLQRHTHVKLWMTSRTQGNTSGKSQRTVFFSARDWWERFALKAGLEWRSLVSLGIPLFLKKNIKIPVLTVSPKDPQLLLQLQEMQPDLIISAGFGRLLPDGILKTARLGAFNCHPSPLPRYAGCDPWFWILRHGETRSAVSIHRMVADADAGTMVAQRHFAVGTSMNHRALYNKSTLESAVALEKCIHNWAKGNFQEEPQDLTQRSFFPGPKEADYHIDWRASARQIHNLVRASSPSPGAWTIARRGRFTVRGVNPGINGSAKAGTVSSIDRHGVCVACGDGAIRLTSIIHDNDEIRGHGIVERLGLSLGDMLQ